MVVSWPVSGTPLSSFCLVIGNIVLRAFQTKCIYIACYRSCDTLIVHRWTLINEFCCFWSYWLDQIFFFDLLNTGHFQIWTCGQVGKAQHIRCFITKEAIFFVLFWWVFFFFFIQPRLVQFIPDCNATKQEKHQKGVSTFAKYYSVPVSHLNFFSAGCVYESAEGRCSSQSAEVIWVYPYQQRCLSLAAFVFPPLT